MIARCQSVPNPAPPALLSPGRNRTKARVFATSWDGRPAVIKSVAHQPAWLRWLAGHPSLNREERAYRRLAGVRGVPSLLARPDRDSLVCERIEGRRLDQHPRRSLPDPLFGVLKEILHQAHERGVAHGDLHRRDVVVDGSGAPWVIDWATSLLLRGRPEGGWRAALFRRWVEVDLRSIEKLRRRYAAGSGAGADALAPHWAPHRWIWRWRRGRILVNPDPAAGNGSDESRRSRLLGHLRLAGLYGGAALLVALARPSLVWLAVGLLPLVIGEAVRWWAAGHLLKSKELVTSGPYAHTQNPLYLGRLLILTGIALMCQAPWGLNWIFLAFGVGGFFGYYLPRKLRVEGARLEGRHGERWQAYQDSVPVLFPARKRYPSAERKSWSWKRMVRNREYLMVLGLAVVVAFLISRLP